MSTTAAASYPPSNTTSYLPKFYAMLPFLVLFIFMLAINWRVTYYPDNDDAYYLTTTQENSFGEFISLRYLNWTGRLFAEVLHYGVFSAPLIYWKFLNTGMIVLLAFSWALLLFGWGFWRRLDHASLLTLWLFCAALGWISHPVLVAAVFWVTGSLDYLWPLVLATFALLPFVERTIHANERTNSLPVWLFPLSGLAGICACLGVEQAAAMMIGVSALCVLYLAYRERRLDFWLVGLLLIFVLATIFSASSPGNFVRYQASLEEFPEFETYSLQKRVYMTISWILESVFFRSRMLTVFLMALILVASAQLHGRRLRWLQIIMAAFTVLLVVTATNWFDFNKPGGDTLTNVLFKFPTPETMLKDLARYGLFSIEFLLDQIPILLWGSALVVTLFAMYHLRLMAGPYDGRILVLFFMIGLGGLFLVSLSPTIYASGPRTTFAFNMVQIFLIAVLFRTVSKTLSVPVMAYIYLFPIVNLLLIGRYLTDLR